jgi:hypothetical protein
MDPRTLLAVLLLLLAAPGPAQSRPLTKQPLSVRVDGYVTSKPEEAPFEVDWTVRLKGENYRLYVSKLQVLTGNAAYYDVIRALEPYRPALTIAGDDRQLDLFATAPHGQKISITGFIRFNGGARYLMISDIEYIGQPEAADAPTNRPLRPPTE